MSTSDPARRAFSALILCLIGLQTAVAFDANSLNRFWTTESRLSLEGYPFTQNTEGCSPMPMSMSPYVSEYGGWLHVCGQWWNHEQVEIKRWYWSSEPAEPFIHPNTPVFANDLKHYGRAPEVVTVTTWTGIWESQLGYLNLTWAGNKLEVCGDRPGSCGGGPNATSGLPD